MMPTNWVIENFYIIQETGGNILDEEEDYLALDQFNSTDWEEQTSAGSG
jgi:hypothetical protein